MGRAVSLSNLLDAPAMPDGRDLGFSGSALQHSTSDAAGAAAAAGDDPDSKRTGWRKGKAPPQWSSKNNVIEMLNELIDELDGIEQQIAQQAVEHIHANEVSVRDGSSSCCRAFSGQMTSPERVFLASLFQQASLPAACRSTAVVVHNSGIMLCAVAHACHQKPDVWHVWQHDISFEYSLWSMSLIMD